MYIPDFFKDLNLEAVISEILTYSKEYPLRRYFYYPATTESLVQYRKEVFLDMENPHLRSVLTDFSRKMRLSREFLSYAESEIVSELKRRHFRFDAAKFYTEAVMELSHTFTQKPSKESTPLFYSKGLTQFRCFLKEYCQSDSFLALSQEVHSLKEALNDLRFRMELSGTKLTIHEDYDTFDARAELMRLCGFSDTKKDSPASMKSPFQNMMELEEFEELLLSMMKKSHTDVFRALTQFADSHGDFYNPILIQFEEEIQVYLSAWEFIHDMRQRGFTFTQPATLSWQESVSGHFFSVQALYDLALACRHNALPKDIIPNDCYYDKGERFFVITGPNQGGKTTFARSVGQAVYFHQMGFFIQARNGALPVFSTLFTHFSADEDVKNGVGKLKEELSRLQPMLHSPVQNGFVILNELFTTATTYDAEIMGKDILRSFMQKGFYGIYVTHIQALAREQNGVVSLAATVEETDEKARTYRVVRKPAQGIAYAQTIAGKYRLSREDILKRIPPEPSLHEKKSTGKD